MNIVVRNWEKFQHADVAKNKLRAPAWIRVYTELHDDPAYLSLTPQQRALLHGIWIEYASTRRQVPVSTAWLSRKLHMRVTKTMLTALKQAGYIDFSHDSIKTTVTPSSGLEEKRKDKDAVGETPQVDVAPSAFDPVELETWQPPAVRRKRGLQVNGRTPTPDEILPKQGRPP